MAAEGTSTDFDNLQRKCQQLIEENIQKDKKILSLEQQGAKKKCKRGKKKTNPGRQQRERLKRAKAAATTTKMDAPAQTNPGRQQRERLKKAKAAATTTKMDESTQVTAECEEVEEAAEEVMEVAATTANKEFLKGLFFENF
ncbi:unnamed protein product [Meloidogyne enterolobii]|uniref:Uncharacterized protein n=1 Tax=Meloidogyne enterolobii TaxID=390850 RepID=A0ACB1B461_MELEN